MSRSSTSRMTVGPTPIRSMRPCRACISRSTAEPMRGEERMKSPRQRARPLGAELLAALSRVSLRRGDLALARIRLIEYLRVVQEGPSDPATALALDLTAELAAATGHA